LQAGEGRVGDVDTSTAHLLWRNHHPSRHLEGSNGILRYAVARRHSAESTLKEQRQLPEAVPSRSLSTHRRRISWAASLPDHQHCARITGSPDSTPDFSSPLIASLRMDAAWPITPVALPDGPHSYLSDVRKPSKLDLVDIAIIHCVVIPQCCLTDSSGSQSQPRPPSLAAPLIRYNSTQWLLHVAS
jgi:hypothetical protein